MILKSPRSVKENQALGDANATSGLMGSYLDKLSPMSSNEGSQEKGRKNWTGISMKGPVSSEAKINKPGSYTDSLASVEISQRDPTNLGSTPSNEARNGQTEPAKIGRIGDDEEIVDSQGNYPGSVSEQKEEGTYLDKLSPMSSVTAFENPPKKDWTGRSIKGSTISAAKKTGVTSYTDSLASQASLPPVVLGGSGQESKVPPIPGTVDYAAKVSGERNSRNTLFFASDAKSVDGMARASSAKMDSLSPSEGVVGMNSSSVEKSSPTDDNAKNSPRRQNWTGIGKKDTFVSRPGGNGLNSYTDLLASRKPSAGTRLGNDTEEEKVDRFFMETAPGVSDISRNGQRSPDRVVGGEGMSERMLRKIPQETQTGGAGGSSTLEAFRKAEESWARLKAFRPFNYDSKLLRWYQDGNGPPIQFVASDGAFGNPKCWEKLKKQMTNDLDFDTVVIGGTLGIFYAAYLQLQGHNVCVIEAGKLRGREQEWNISMDELIALLDIGILTQQDIDDVITTEFPACRSGFKNQEVTPLEGGYFENGIGFECETPGVLNLGVAPKLLLERVSKRFQENGGVIKEQTRLKGICVSELIGTAIDLGDDIEPITSRLLLDCMGNASPISAQQRHGMKPDGICAVVGSCAAGYDKKSNLLGDIIYTNQPILDKSPNGHLQYFWEAFPVGIGRNGIEPGSSDVKTTYMFTYMDADDSRPSLKDLMEDYWRLLPIYQPSIKNPETDLDVKRILFAYFPTYRDSPLKPNWSRILAVGDASGIQSPLSFGGFGALTRHLDRVGGAISEALDNDCLHKDDLGEINAYMPNLSASWMFQKAMSVRPGQKPNPEFVNRLLATNFQIMDEMGQRTIKPFLQDVIRFDGLVGSLARSFIRDPLFMPEIIATVGLPALVDWMGHVGNVSLRRKLITFFRTRASPRCSRILDGHIRFLGQSRVSYSHTDCRQYEECSKAVSVETQDGCLEIRKWCRL